MLNDQRIKSCLSRFDSGAYSRLHFLRAVSHSVGAHTACLQLRDDDGSSSSENEDQQEPVPVATSPTSDSTTSTEATASDDCCEVCFVVPRGGFALVPCGHARFCEACAMRVSVMEGGCPVCRSEITMVMRIFPR